MKYIYIVFLIVFTNTIIAQKKKIFDLVKDFGAKPDNKTDNYNAFIKAAETISQNGGGILNIPKGKYYIASYKIEGGDEKNNIKDIIFRNCKGLVIYGNNSTIRVNGKFTRKADFKKPGFNYNYSYTHTVCPFLFINCKDVILQDIVLYGEADKMKKEKGVPEGYNYGVAVYDIMKTDSSKNIILKNIVTHHFATDGIIISMNGKNADIINCKSYCNARQALSITRGKDIRCYDSSFDSTGNTGSYGAHSPGAGIDVENEYEDGALRNVSIIKCNIRGNVGFQVVTTLRSESVKIDSCFISDKTGGYSSALNGIGMLSPNSIMSNSVIYGTFQIDIGGNQYKGDSAQLIRNNIIYSGLSAFLCASHNRPVNISNNIIIMLPNPKTDNYFPYIQSTNCIFTNNLVVIHPDILAKKPAFTALMQYNKKNSNNFWLLNKVKYSGNIKVPAFYNIAFHKSNLTDNQFFPINEITNKINVRGKKLLNQNQINNLISSGIFSAFQQKKFNKKNLIQADEVKKRMKKIINSTL
ncbi:MAG: hypothetical protein IPJ81_05360 [Chitinophagaceae bacterium]|nr:hypothetical protein [Chitinophagaceae bacterium]